MSATTRVKCCMVGMTRATGLLVLVSVLAGGCNTGGSNMTKVERISGPEQGKVLVTFVRPNLLGAAISFGIWDTENFVGILGAGTCIQYQTTPGEHYFLARAENWSCVKANLAAGKQYVLKANPFFGVWKARVELHPVTQADYEKKADDVQKWLTKLTPMAPNPQHVDAYVQSRRAQVVEARTMFESGKGKSEVLAAEDCLPPQ